MRSLLQVSESLALQTFDFRFLASKTVKEYISFVLSHPGCGTLLQQPKNENSCFFNVDQNEGN